MQPNEVTTKVREMIAKHPPLKSAMETGWNRICDRIEQRALSVRPKPKVFEVHHQTQRARLSFLTEVTLGRSPELAEIIALESVGIA